MRGDRLEHDGHAAVVDPHTGHIVTVVDQSSVCLSALAVFEQVIARIGEQAISGELLIDEDVAADFDLNCDSLVLAEREGNGACSVRHGGAAVHQVSVDPNSERVEVASGVLDARCCCFVRAAHLYRCCWDHQHTDTYVDIERLRIGPISARQEIIVDRSCGSGCEHEDRKDHCDCGDELLRETKHVIFLRVSCDLHVLDTEEMNDRVGSYTPVEKFLRFLFGRPSATSLPIVEDDVAHGLGFVALGLLLSAKAQSIQPRFKVGVERSTVDHGRPPVRNMLRKPKIDVLPRHRPCIARDRCHREDTYERDVPVVQQPPVDRFEVHCIERGRVLGWSNVDDTAVARVANSSSPRKERLTPSRDVGIGVIHPKPSYRERKLKAHNTSLPWNARLGPCRAAKTLPNFDGRWSSGNHQSSKFEQDDVSTDSDLACMGLRPERRCSPLALGSSR